MRTRTCATMEREGMRVVAHGEKWCRPQPVSRKSAPVTAASGPSAFEKRFWLFGCGVVLLWICLRVFDFTLLPPAYHGLLLTQPFCGLHSWDLADRAWAARSHLKYGLGYTKGLRTLVVGDPPPLIPEYYVSHPPLETWILAFGMLIFGAQDWSVRLFELVFSLPCLLLILLLLRKLHGSACALLSGSLGGRLAAANAVRSRGATGNCRTCSSKPTVGFEPTTTGLQNRSCETVNVEGGYTYDQQGQSLTPQLTPESPKQAEIEPTPLPPDLAEVVAAWPGLPAHIKAAIRALVQADSGNRD